jgi:hypothetical protein
MRERWHPPTRHETASLRICIGFAVLHGAFQLWLVVLSWLSIF